MRKISILVSVCAMAVALAAGSASAYPAYATATGKSVWVLPYRPKGRRPSDNRGTVLL